MLQTQTVKEAFIWRAHGEKQNWVFVTVINWTHCPFLSSARVRDGLALKRGSQGQWVYSLCSAPKRVPEAIEEKEGERVSRKETEKE